MATNLRIVPHTKNVYEYRQEELDEDGYRYEYGPVTREIVGKVILNNPTRIDFHLIVKYSGLSKIRFSAYEFTQPNHIKRFGNKHYRSILLLGGLNQAVAVMTENEDVRNLIKVLVDSQKKGVIGVDTTLIGVINDKLQETGHWISPLVAQFWADANNASGLCFPKKKKTRSIFD